ncbi:diaminopropionate ammonia-lyase [Kribbella speibonae]|uniref:Diaminopropionate ammonia-lyase n=1 Tax=Kribbella speibonae TaxID=1572660 RepID=A0A4V2M4L6_9ACTN|nr:diaminopropionate ammonia-lyase [Kribbella speibonae]TCC36382.1 diaminopropionate ammonia-lyase [Kribbella speibonae]
MWHLNSTARSWTTTPATGVTQFHESLPGYAPTRLVEVPGLAAELGVGRLFVKEESSRLGLPAFKVLGAAYAVSRALSTRFGETDRALPLPSLRLLADEYGPVTLIAATDGNHGRAVAHLARLIGLPAQIFVPDSLTGAAKAGIASEGAQTTELALDYDDVVMAARQAASVAGPDALLIQDTAWPGYTEIPQWIVDGYSTLFTEADIQLAAIGAASPALVVVPIGVGSLAQASVRHYRSTTRVRHLALLGVEPENAPAIVTSLNAGKLLTVPTRQTIMAGLNCGTPSHGAWPDLRSGLDAAVTVTDSQTATAVHDLEAAGIDSGPCGAATLAAGRVVLDRYRDDFAVPPDATVLLLSTEGRAANPLPEDV